MGRDDKAEQSVASDLRLDPETVTSVSRLADPSGVLSMYADLEPSNPSSSREKLLLDLEVQLFGAIASAKPPARKRLYAFRDEIERLVEDIVPGTGRAHFYGVETGRSLTVFTPEPFGPVLKLRSRAFVLPLMCAIKRRHLVGVITLSHNHITVVEAKPGHFETITEYGPGEYAGDWTIRGEESSAAGGAASNGHTAPHVGSRHDTHPRWHWHRIALDVHHLGQQRGWEALVVSGDSQSTEALQHQLETLGNQNVLTTDKGWADGDRSHVAQYGLAMATEARLRREAALVSELIYQAVPRGDAVCGLDATMKAMVGHEVDTLMFSCDPGQDFGWTLSECLEQMVELALTDGAEILPVSGEASLELSRHEGFAARLGRPYKVRDPPAATDERLGFATLTEGLRGAGSI